MASSPSSDPTDPDAEALLQNPSLIEKPSVVEQGSISLENVAEKALNLESTQDEETQNLQDPEDSDGRDQQLEASIEESRNEEDDMDTTQAVSSSYYRRGGGPKRKKGIQKKRKQLEKSKEKLEVLLKTLKPIAFVPCKTLDFARHEKLLKTLGLWDFVHLEFDQNIRQDLVANLVAYYNSEGRCSYVNGARINVSRADLARALKLPKKKDFVVTEEERELLENDESVRFIDEILSTWVLLQRDDMWIMPVEIVEWTRDIKQKHLEKLDWPKLLWFMVEKELKAEPLLGDCFFASHLQLLIKTQKEDLLKEKCKADNEGDDDDDDDDVKEVDFMVKSPKEDCLEVKEEDVGAADSGKDDGAIDSKEDKYVEEHMIELNLGQETVSEMVSGEERGPVEGQPMDVEENKKEEDERWAWNEDTHAGSHFLRRCNLSSAREEDEDNHIEGSMEMGEDEPIEDVGEEDEEDTEKHEEGFPFFPNGDSLQGVGQENLMLGDASPLGYNSGLQIHGNSIGGDFLASRVDMHMTMGSGSSSLFGNGNNKREIEHENHISYNSHNPSNKRLRTEEPSWDEKPPPVDMCLDQMVYWIEKTRLSNAEKDREREQSVMNQQYLMNELQSKAAMIQELERTKFEEQQRKDMMIYKLESELRMMTSVVEGYRKALKETQKASREHRKRCPLRDEKPVYKDVKGSGGLVLCTTEIEKLRLKQEEEDRMTRTLVERQIEDFESRWLNKFEEHMETVELLNERFIENENEVKILRETLSESKNHETSEVAAATEEVAAATEEAATEET
ncbi:hypothetical protein ISN45_Aa05g027210 [Arabidopsis thaliana x Arabidopsis arenosa]|uniref:Uncharacterized protein n=1 Tax=Arabidopsis thaliana x Arabidopsis arenosa TaxID=1240361 RepID=A0A8T1ZT16_9BRAS|nr:hypothetical protein ISN45_Aa05g027210 [Arabidopsis thaliana x Arabidopsis arenosa]